jgi:hypothetical protein
MDATPARDAEIEILAEENSDEQNRTPRCLLAVSHAGIVGSCIIACAKSI